MNTMDPNEPAWNRLARAAARAPEESVDLPFGFATRVLSGWKSGSAERLWGTLEFFTWRGLAVAFVIVAGSMAVGYDAVSGFLSGDASLPDDMVQIISSLTQ